MLRTPSIRTEPTPIGEASTVMFGALDDPTNLLAIVSPPPADVLAFLRAALAPEAKMRTGVLLAPLTGPETGALYFGLEMIGGGHRALLLRGVDAGEVPPRTNPAALLAAFRAELGITA